MLVERVFKHNITVELINFEQCVDFVEWCKNLPFDVSLDYRLRDLSKDRCWYDEYDIGVVEHNYWYLKNLLSKRYSNEMFGENVW